ncbi:MAG TPA: hypothetical protein VI233_09870, partial [Puia sp.]
GDPDGMVEAAIDAQIDYINKFPHLIDVLFSSSALPLNYKIAFNLKSRPSDNFGVKCDTKRVLGTEFVYSRCL